jgi:hypothetical protein
MVSLVRDEAMLMLSGGSLAIAVSTLPFITIFLAQWRKSANSPDGNTSLYGGIFWAYLGQFFATTFGIFGFYIFDIMNKGGKYKFVTGNNTVIDKFWDVQTTDVLASYSEEIKTAIYTTVNIKTWFFLVNGILPLLIGLGCFAIGFFANYRLAKKNGDSMMFPIFHAFATMFLGFVGYVAYSWIAGESLFIDTSLLDLSRRWWT